MFHVMEIQSNIIQYMERRKIVIEVSSLADNSRERFTGLNFHVFHGFQEYCESFSVNIYLQALYNAVVQVL